VHPLYPYNRGPGTGPGRYPQKERRRLGLEALIEPGEVVPLTVSWRIPRDGRKPVRIDYGPGSLALE
jgi:hypothetical protein